MLLALLWARPFAVHAEAPEAAESKAPPEAKSHFERGREHFRAGRYREAIVELKAALELDPESPTLMYNVAYANELLGEIEEAIVYYRKYLDALPSSAGEEREKIRLTLRRLEGFREQVEAEPESDRESAAAPLPARETQTAQGTSPGVGRADALFWISLSAGVAMFGGAAATGMLALDREDAVAQFVVGEDGSIAQRQKLIDEADRFALTSDLLIGGGAALVTAAGLLFFLRSSDEESAHAPKSVRALLTSDGSGASLWLRGSF